VGDNYILKSDPEEQTFRVSKIVKHGNFKPLGSGDDGDGRNDIALVRVVNALNWKRFIALFQLLCFRKSD